MKRLLVGGSSGTARGIHVLPISGRNFSTSYLINAGGVSGVR